MPGKAYRQIGVRLWGEGAYERESLDGGQTKYARLFKAEAHDIIVNKIWARNGSVAVVTQALSGCYGSGEFPMFSVNQDCLTPEWIHWLTKTPQFWSQCDEKSRGTSGKNRIRPEKFLELEIPLPTLQEQQTLTTRLAALAKHVRQVIEQLAAIEVDLQRLLAARFCEVVKGAPYGTMAEVAPVVRRPVKIDADTRYREIGARSFGKGLFMKPEFNGAEATWEKPVWVEKDDLVLSNIKAWEGAIAVAEREHAGCIASHRYITCVPNPEVATAGFLCYYLLTQDGLEKIGVASPGTADRNRTLRLGSLGETLVPVPSLESQQKFDVLSNRVAELRAQHVSIRAATAALLPALMNRVFPG